MSTTRIKDLTTASSIANDDYIAIDGATNGTRKILASDVGGSETLYSVTTSSTTSSLDQRGVSSLAYSIHVSNASELTIENLSKMKAFATLSGDTDHAYPLEITNAYFAPSVPSMTIGVKSHNGNPQSETASYFTNAYITVVAPFEMTSITATK